MIHSKYAALNASLQKVALFGCRNVSKCLKSKLQECIKFRIPKAFKMWRRKSKEGERERGKGQGEEERGKGRKRKGKGRGNRVQQILGLGTFKQE